VNTDHNLFYWFFRQSTNPNAPVVLWLNGGPGSTSMWGLFMEVGPLRVTQGTGGDDDFKINPAASAWTDDYNVVFLDNPVGVGFSWPETPNINMDVGSQDFLDFMRAFYVKYPELKNNDFILTGESYAGKYVPHYAVTIINANVDAKPADKINLVSCMIIDPYTVPLLQRTSMYQVGQYLNILDQDNMDQISRLNQGC
jgi:carboxypeptidase C (cathepsin A)